jgi:type VI protein secretion system component Hcp
MAQAVYLVKFDGIKGDTKDTKWQDCFEVDSMSFGGSNTKTLSARGSTPGEPVLSDLQLSKSNIGPGTVQMFDQLVRGKKFPSVLVHCVERDDQAQSKEWLQIKLTNAYVTSQSMSFSSGGAMESIGLVYEQIVFTYSDPNVPAGYNLIERKAVTS